MDRESLAEIALYFNKTLKEINDHIDEWNYDFLTATYYLLLFMKMQGRQPKIKSNMKKYSQFITYANCTITSTTAVGNMNSTTSQSTSIASQSLPPSATSSSTSAAQTNANRILVEKQLANLATSGATPKIMNPSNVVKSNNNSGNTKPVSNKPPQQQQQHQHSENTNPNQPVTPHPKSLSTNTAPAPATSANQKPKQLFFDEINTKTGDTNKNTSLATKREARSKTKTSASGGVPSTTVAATKSNTISAATGAAISNALKNATSKKKDHSSDTCSSTSSTSSTSSSESSESLSASSSSSANNGDSNNFAMPSRVTRSKNK